MARGGKHPDPAKAAEIARKKSAAMKRHYRDAAFRKRQSDGVLDKWKDPAYRAKISKARKEQHAKARAERAAKRAAKKNGKK